MKHSLLVPALALCSLQASAGDWHSEVTTAIESGKFKEAKAIMNAQPKTRENLVTIDSFQIIMNRISYDFSLTPAKGVEMVRERIPGVTDNEINSWIEKKYIETMTIDGETKWMRKSVRNLFLLNPDLIVPEAKDGSGTALLQYRTRDAGRCQPLPQLEPRHNHIHPHRRCRRSAGRRDAESVDSGAAHIAETAQFQAHFIVEQRYNLAKFGSTHSHARAEGCERTPHGVHHQV